MQPVQKSIYFVEGTGYGRSPYCNSVVIDDAVRVIIDPNCGQQQLAKLAAQGVDIVINSHFHADHTASNYRFPEAQIWIHALDASALQSLDEFIRRYGFTGPEEMRVGQEFMRSRKMRFSPVHRELREGEVLDFGRVKLRVVHTPGHTPGHCAFYQEKTGLLLLGDIDLTGFGPWYAHACSDIDDFISSIKRCLEIAPRQIISSHKGIFTDHISERLHAYLHIIYRKEANIYSTLHEPQTLEQLVEKQLFYERYIPLNPREYFFEKMGIVKHLERLLKHQKIRQEGLCYYQTGN